MTRDMSMMAYDIHVDILLRCVNVCDGTLHVHCSPHHGIPISEQGVFRKTTLTIGRF